MDAFVIGLSAFIGATIGCEVYRLLGKFIRTRRVLRFQPGSNAVKPDSQVERRGIFTRSSAKIVPKVNDDANMAARELNQ